MKNILRYSPAAFLTAVLFALPLITSAPTQVPNAGGQTVATNAAVTAVVELPVATTTPIKVAETEPEPTAIMSNTLRIPSIKFKSLVIPVGLNAKGEMDVPDGESNNVGWYKYGPEPGEVGSAVLDAHVYAAFENLKDVAVGDSIYVTNADGDELHFVVEETTTTRLEETSAARLFERTDKARLNLITCAGTYIASKGTYDHRLIVYAVLVA